MKEEMQWDPKDRGLNKDPHPGNYSTGKEDMEDADPEQRDPEERKRNDKEDEGKEDKFEKDLNTGTPNKGGG